MSKLINKSRHKRQGYLQNGWVGSQQLTTLTHTHTYEERKSVHLGKTEQQT